MKILKRFITDQGIKLILGRSGIEGRGVYADQEIGNGEYIIEYAGEKIPSGEGSKRSDTQCAKGALYVFTLNSRYDIDATVNGNEARFINHSCAPNCESEWQGGKIWIASRRRIRPGEELHYDYGFELETDYDQKANNYLEVCRCGTKRCRGFVMNYDSYAKFKRKLGSEKYWAMVKKHARQSK